MEFYTCLNCNNIVTQIGAGADVLQCCDEKMKKLEVGIVEASLEKHIPIVDIDGDRITVKVAKEMHPMEEKHFIGWVCVQTDKGFMIEYLKPSTEPQVIFYTKNQVLNVYAYCNLHGLWKANI